MLYLYFKQAWNILRQEKLFSSIYILGTGLSITLVMVLSIVYYIKIANIYPETNRDRMLIVKSCLVKLHKGDQWSGTLSYKVLEEVIFPTHTAEAIAVTCSQYEENYIQPVGSFDQLPVAIKYTNTGFWDVFNFQFIDGKPFTQADFQSGIHSAVIAESLARKLFGTTEVTGKHLSLDFRPYRIAGVVKDVSYVTERTYAQLWVPYTVIPEYKQGFGIDDMLGRFNAFLLCPPGKIEQVSNEILENGRRLSNTIQEGEFSLLGQPDRHWQSIFRFNSNTETDLTKVGFQHTIIFLILLLIPAISLSGMADSRMERRLAEIGVRRAFGAPNAVLMRQVLTENLLYTLLGGIIGLILSYLIILAGRNWIMSIGQTFSRLVPEGTEVVFTTTMFLNAPIFLITFGVCLMLNLLSAFIPAWRASRREIVHSLNAN